MSQEIVTACVHWVLYHAEEESLEVEEIQKRVNEMTPEQVREARELDARAG